MNLHLDNVLYVPDCPAHLLCLQQIDAFTNHDHNSCKLTKDKAIVTVNGDDLSTFYNDYS